MIEATEKQLGLLWRTLGLCAERSDRRSISRNHVLTSPGYDDSNNLDLLVAAGLMTRGKAPAFCSEDEVVYRATDEGKQFALDKLPPPPPPAKRTKFHAYLDECEYYDGFAHFLGINQPQIQQRGNWGTTNTVWSDTHAEVPTASIAGLPVSRTGRPTKLLRSPVSGRRP